MTKARDLANIISGGLTADDIPALPASKITSGALGADRIPDLAASKITSGAFADARIPDLASSKVTSGTFADARLSSSSVTQHVDLTALSATNLTSGTVPSARLSLGASDIPNLDTAKVTTGTFADARISSGSVTQHVSAVTSASGTWTPAVSSGSVGSDNVGIYSRTNDIVHCYSETYFDSYPNNDEDIWYWTGLPITPADKSHGSSGVAPIGWGHMHMTSVEKIIVVFDNGHIRPLNQGRDGRLLFTTDRSSSGYQSGITGNSDMRPFYQYSWRRWFYMEFWYQV